MRGHGCSVHLNALLRPVACTNLETHTGMSCGYVSGPGSHRECWRPCKCKTCTSVLDLGCQCADRVGVNLGRVALQRPRVPQIRGISPVWPGSSLGYPEGSKNFRDSVSCRSKAWHSLISKNAGGLRMTWSQGLSCLLPAAEVTLLLLLKLMVPQASQQQAMSQACKLYNNLSHIDFGAFCRTYTERIGQSHEHKPVRTT